VLAALGRGIAVHPDDGLVVLRARRDERGAVEDLVHEWVNDAVERNAGRPLLGAGLLLQLAAQRMRRAMRSDDVVTRYGGDEFVLVCHRVTGDDEARTPADRLQDAVAGRFHRDGDVEVEVGVSVAIAIALTDRLVPTHDLLERADRALYAAKAGADRPVHPRDGGSPDRRRHRASRPAVPDRPVRD
jgi:predicted signal transduction protein with EAL and GGDEF domain